MKSSICPTDSNKPTNIIFCMCLPACDVTMTKAKVSLVSLYKVCQTFTETYTVLGDIDLSESCCKTTNYLI